MTQKELRAMTQKKLRAKLESYDLKGATLKQLLADRDIARDMYKSLSNLYGVIFHASNTVWATRSSEDLENANSKLFETVRLEADMRFKHMCRLADEIDERLSKMGNN